MLEPSESGEWPTWRGDVAVIVLGRHFYSRAKEAFMRTKSGFAAFALCALISLGSLSAQGILGVSVGGGFGDVKQDFSYSGGATSLSYAAPSAYIAAELDYGRWYMDMSLALLFGAKDVKVGGRTWDLSGYSSNAAADFNAFGVGYLYPLSDKLSAGGALGFHVASIMLTPANENDTTLLAFGGYYGTIGLSIVPRARYALSDKLALTFSLPIGFDFSKMSDEVVVLGEKTGATSPAVVQPSWLEPKFTGFTIGAYITIGYFFQLTR
jgi:hypothetical protein